MSDTIEFKQDLMMVRNWHVNMQNEIKNYIGREIYLGGKQLFNFPENVKIFKIEDIDIAENYVSVSWWDEDENDSICDYMTILQFVQHAQFK